jgi:CubicO group peptidase (beta-lactamase class C family)
MDRIDKYQQSVGIVVGVIEPKGRRIVAYGALDQGNPQPLNGDTVFEIGSITKVFTALLLADMAQRGELALNDPVAKYLPPEVKVPERAGRQITLLDLATHTSGLPGDPSNISPQDPANPVADYSVELLYAFLSNYTLTRDIGSRYEYSNLGTSVLGQVVAHHSGMDYDATSRVANSQTPRYDQHANLPQPRHEDAARSWP